MAIQPTYGELIDLFELVEDEHSGDETVLCALFRENYPDIDIGRPGRFFETVQSIVAPVQSSMLRKPPLSGSPLVSYRRRKWKPRVRNPQKGVLY